MKAETFKANSARQIIAHQRIEVGADQLEALHAKCALPSASRRQAEAVQATAITDSEGGEL